MKGFRHSSTAVSSATAFSLLEVVVALAICVFVLVAVMGLFAAGVQTSHQSESEIQAANLASLILSTRRAAPLSAAKAAGVPALPPAAMTNAFADACRDRFVGLDGMLTDNARNAAYWVTCRAGTNALTGPHVAQVYLILSWPVQVNPSLAASHHYEITTCIPF